MPDKLLRADEVVWRKIDDNVVIVDVDATNILTLNSTAAFLWEQCDGTRNEKEIAEVMADTYDADYNEILEDVTETTKQLEEKGLLYWSNS